MIPDHAPFSPEQRQSLSALLAGVTPQQSLWLSGYLAGVTASGVVPAAGSASVGTPANLTVLFGTESGNCEELADRTVKAAKKKGIKASLRNLAEISPADLSKLENVGLIVSTWGDGEPPEAIEGFHKAFLTESPDLKGTRFSVCALGDTSYEKFCEIGKQYDARLLELGAERIVDRVDCDVDYEDSYGGWADQLFAALAETQMAVVAAPPLEITPAEVFDKKNPFPSEVLDNVLLNGEGSSKETIHVELNLEGSGLDYEAGDALAVVPENAADVVEAVIRNGQFSPTEMVTHKAFEGELSLKEAFSEKLDITALSRAIVKKYQALDPVATSALGDLLAEDQKAEFSAWIWGRQIVDLLAEFPISGLKAQDFVNILRKLPPRLYSIASSPKAHPGEVHLTVAAVRYDTHERSRKGVASTYLADDTPKGAKVKVYVHKNKNFRLPEDDNAPVIMVGPGTGVAPFRAFVEERGEREAKGESWLFFGDQKYSFDFLYQLEWQDHLKSGALSRLDVAFSRDQPEKVYVQDVMRSRAAELYQWLEKGAYFYVCGDAQYMAKDVHDALIEIIATEGGKSAEEAAAYVDELKKTKRYQRDVY